MASLNPKKILLYISITVLTISVPAAVFLATQPRTTVWQGRAGLEKSTLLYFWPAQVTLAACPANVPVTNCPSSKIEVILSSKQKIGGFNLVIKYDPAKIHLVDNLIYPGNVDEEKNAKFLPFEYYTNRYVDNRQGLVKLEAHGQLKEEKATVASFWVTGIEPGETTIEIIDDANLLDSTKVWDESNQNNVLASTNPLKITIK